MTFYRKNNLICLIEQNNHEPLEHFLERCNFITSQPIKNNNDYNKAILYSRLYINHKYLKCTYNDDVMSELNKMKSNLHHST